MAKNYIDRPPRIQPELPQGEYTIPAPPQNDENGNQALLQAALPMVTIFGYILVSMLGGRSRSPLLIIPMALAVVASSFLAFYSYKRTKKLREIKQEAYRQALIGMRKDMLTYHDMQRTFYHYNYPEPDTTLRIAADLGRDPAARQEDSRSGSRIWERRSTDKDFGCLRLGVGTLPSTVTYKMQNVDDFSLPLIGEALRLQDDSRYVNNVSITIPLRETASAAESLKLGGQSTARHAIGVAGNNPEAVYAFTRAMLVDFAAYQSPTDAAIYVVGTYASRQQWRWAYPLPHCKEGKKETLVFEDETRKEDETEPNKVALFWRNIRTILERRKIRLEDKNAGADVTLPLMLVVVDLLSPAPDWSPLRDLESDAAVSLLLQEGPRLGAAVIFLVPNRSKVPSACLSVIEVEVEAEKTKSVFRYAEVNVNTPRYVGEAAVIPAQDAARDFARKLEPLSIRRAYGADLAASVTLLEMMNIADMDALRSEVIEKWQKSTEPKAADWLHTHVGLLSGNEPRKLVFSAKADGVHGLIAGSTGSGKSELLSTLILGIALDYDPSVANFVLVDYKGGAAFEPFRNLPHVVDIVTNLEGSATARMFASVKAELDRRQKINTFSDCKDIVHYRKKALHQRPDAPPYPFLFIIIDEFAEMISGNAEFKSQLESITRLGRALGVHLILAAQRPIGVTDQMRANIKFRICLRVETPDDSRELLRRSDAAYLPPTIPGRGYLQIGNENVELIQTAYAGGDYLGPQQTVSPNVIWLNRPKKSDRAKQEEPPKLYDVIVAMCAGLAATAGSDHQWRPWPKFLPRTLYLQSPVDTAYVSESDVAFLRGEEHNEDTKSVATGPVVLNPHIAQWLEATPHWKGVNWSEFAMRPVVGIIDNPFDARQIPLVVNLPVGHSVLFGASGWGKTTYLRTLILGLAAVHSPDELHVYILDFGGRNLTVFRDLPHVGAVITSDEEERVQRMLRKLGTILERRQALLSEAGITDLYTYNTKNPDKRLPAILVAIDNFAEFKENFEGQLPTLISLVRDARAYGIHFAITADQPNALPNKLFSLITERMTLKLSDAGEYTGIVGRGVPDISPINGRGYTRIGRTPLEFQIALPLGMDMPAGQDESELLKSVVLKMKAVWAEGWKGERPATIDTLPTRVSLERVLQMRPPVGKRIQPVMGIDDFELEPYLIDFQKQGPHLIVVGPSNSGKTTTLRSLVLSLASSYSPNDLMMVLVDFQRRFADYGGKYSLSKLPHVVQVLSKGEQVEEFAASLSVECKDFEAHPGRKKIYVIIDNYDSFSDDGYKKARKAFDDIAVLLREYSTQGLHFVAAGSLAFLSASEDVRKQIQASNFGLALQSGDAVGRLNGKVPRSLADTELPGGRGFVVKSGRTMMLQIATPYSNDDDVEGSLDAWMEQLLKRYEKEPQAAWLRKPDAPAGGGAAPAQTIDYDALKVLLKAKGMGDALLASLPQDALVSTAKRYGIEPPLKAS